MSSANVGLSTYGLIVDRIDFPVYEPKRIIARRVRRLLLFHPAVSVLGVAFTTLDGTKSAVILINADHIKKRLISCTLPTEKWVRLVGGGRVFKAAATTTK